jgi:hypothetical protein
MKVKGMKAMKAKKEKPMKAMKEKAMKAEKKKHVKASKILDPEARAQFEAKRKVITDLLKPIHSALNQDRYTKPIPHDKRVRLEAERDRLVAQRDALNNPPAADPIGDLLADLMKE